MEKTGEPLEGHYKVALGGGAYYEVTFEKVVWTAHSSLIVAVENYLQNRTSKREMLNGKSVEV